MILTKAHSFIIVKNKLAPPKLQGSAPITSKIMKKKSKHPPLHREERPGAIPADSCSISDTQNPSQAGRRSEERNAEGSFGIGPPKAEPQILPIKASRLIPVKRCQRPGTKYRPGKHCFFAETAKPQSPPVHRASHFTTPDAPISRRTKVVPR